MQKIDPSGIVTLTTDFGTKDIFVAVMKAVILRINPSVRLVDITHEVSPQDIPSASFLFNAAHGYFPPGTIHLVVIDPGVGSNRKGIAVQTDHGIMVAPDNGVLTEAIANYPNILAVSLENQSYFLSEISHTFHGRDLFAPVAAYLSNGTAIAELGPWISELVRIPISTPKIKNHCLQGEIRYIDRYGNLITNIDERLFRQFCDNRGNFAIRIKDQSVRGLCQSYQESPVGSVLAIFNSFNRLELAMYKGNAADKLGAFLGTKVSIEILPR